jgi:hypothetical protein
MASTCHQLGNLAYLRGDYDEAARQHQRALDISERLGDPAGMATTYSQVGVLARDRGGSADQSVALPMRPYRSASASASLRLSLICAAPRSTTRAG